MAPAQQKTSRTPRAIEFLRQTLRSARQEQGFSDQAGAAVDSRPAVPAGHERAPPRTLAG